MPAIQNLGRMLQFLILIASYFQVSSTGASDLVEEVKSINAACSTVGISASTTCRTEKTKPLERKEKDPSDPSNNIFRKVDFATPLKQSMEAAGSGPLAAQSLEFRSSKSLEAVRRKTEAVLKELKTKGIPINRPLFNFQIQYSNGEYYPDYQFLAGGSIADLHDRLTISLVEEWEAAAQDPSLHGLKIGTPEESPLKLDQLTEKLTKQSLALGSSKDPNTMSQVASLQKSVGILNRLRNLQTQLNHYRKERDQHIRDWQETPEWKAALDASVKLPNSIYEVKHLVKLLNGKLDRTDSNGASEVVETVSKYDPFLAIYLAHQLPKPIRSKLIEDIKFTPEARIHSNRLTDARYFVGTDADKFQRRVLLGLLDNVEGLSNLGIKGGWSLIASRMFFLAVSGILETQSQLDQLTKEEQKVLSQLRKIIARFNQRASIDQWLDTIAAQLGFKPEYGHAVPPLQDMINLLGNVIAEDMQNFLKDQPSALLGITNTGDEREWSNIWEDFQSGTLQEKIVPTSELTDPSRWRKLQQTETCSDYVKVYGFFSGKKSLPRKSAAPIDKTQLEEEWLPYGHKRHAVVLGLEKNIGNKPLSRSELHLPPQQYGTCWYRAFYGRIRQTLIKSLGIASYKKIARFLKQNMLANIIAIGDRSDESSELMRIAANKIYAAQLREERYQIANDTALYADAMEGPFKPDVRRKLIARFKLDARASDQDIQKAALDQDRIIREKTSDNSSEYIRKRAEVLQILIPKPVVIRRVRPIAKDETKYIKNLDQALKYANQILELKTPTQSQAAALELEKWLTQQFQHIHSIYYPDKSINPGDPIEPFQYEHLSDRMVGLANAILKLRKVASDSSNTIEEELTKVNLFELAKAKKVTELHDALLLSNIQYFVRNGTKSKTVFVRFINALDQVDPKDSNTYKAFFDAGLDANLYHKFNF